MKHFALIFTALFFQTAIGSAVVYWDQEFFETPASSDTHFWGQISTYDQWLEKDRASILKIDPHPQYTASSEGHPMINSPELTPADIHAELGSPVAEEYVFFLNSRGDGYFKFQERGDFPPQSALVFEVKMSTTLSKTLNPEALSVDAMIQLLQTIDAPHSHIPVSKNFAHSVLEDVHSGHRQIDAAEESNSALVFSSIRMQDYNCGILKSMIATMSELQGESVMENSEGESVVNIYSLGLLEKITGNDLDRFTPVFGRRPDLVLSQEMLYVSRFVKDMGNYWAFFDNGDGTTQVVSYTLVATSTKFKYALDVVLNGPTTLGVTEAIGNGAAGKASDTVNGVVDAADAVLDSLFGSGDSEPAPAAPTATGFPKIINTDLVDLNAGESPSACKSGLALGLPFYAQKLFRGVLEQF